jgi:hypothetical protein
VPTPLEAEISVLLKEHRQPERVAEILLKRWSSGQFSLEEQSDCALFLVAAGLYPLLFKHVLNLLNQKILPQLPWTAIAEGFGRAKLKPSEQEIDALIEGAQKQNAEPALLRSYQLDLWSRAFTSRREQLARAENKEMHAEQRWENDLQVSALKNRPAQQNPVLKTDHISPKKREHRLRDGDEFHTPSVESFSPEIMLAKQVIDKSFSSQNLTEQLRRKLDRLPEELTSMKDLIVNRSVEMAQNDPHLAYDLALNLHFMSLDSDAIRVLEFALPSAAVDWLRLELMIQSRQFVSALDIATRMEIDYAADPESAFAVAYNRARALHGLGEIGSAIELIETLVRVRPNYKSAEALLREWLGDDL